MNKVIKLTTVELELLKASISDLPFSTKTIVVFKGVEYGENDFYLVEGELLFRRGLL